MSLSEQAFAYHVQGYSIIPCKQDKKPALASWKKYQTECATDDEVIAWWQTNPQSNIGIITGKLSNLTVIDVDNKGIDGQKRADEMLKKFPATRTIQTPSGGYHLYYKYQEGFTVSANAYPSYPNVDIRGETGFVIAPPSQNVSGKQYIVIDNREPIAFPSHLFPVKKTLRKLSSIVAVSSGSRNDSITSAIGRLLRAERNESEWYTEVWGAIVHMNKTYSPPLSEQELKTTFDSIVKKEKEQRARLLSPLQLKTTDGDDAEIPLRKTQSNIPHRDMANAYLVLKHHPYYRDAIKYNTFTSDIEYNGKPIEDADINKIQYFMQTDIGLSGIGSDTVFSAIVHYANQNKYDEAQDWLTALQWDGTPRLSTWLSTATGVPNDAYHRGIGAQWMTGIVSRIMKPGCIWDYMLVLIGKQGVGKTSLFRIIGGPWYKSFTGSMDNKDFYLTLRGAIVIDLDEGATLYRSEAIKIKSIITQTHDEFRAPYDRVMKKYPRRFVFSMSTNDDEPFRDVTGNRRYWVLDLPDTMIKFKWLEDNRDQLFAEAYYNFKNKIKVDEVPMDEAEEMQQNHLPEDSWSELVVNEVKKSVDYCEGDENYSITVQEIFEKIFPNEGLIRLDRRHEMRIGSILRKDLGMIKSRRMIDGTQKNRWFISSRKISELKAKKAIKTFDPMNDVF